MKIRWFSFLIVLLFFTTKSFSQLLVGANFSTFNVPAADFRIGGLGVDIENRTEKGTGGIAANFFSKQLPLDSTRTTDNNGNTYYAKYHTAYNIIILSLIAKEYVVGSNKLDDKFSVFLGGGCSYARNSISTNYEQPSNLSGQTMVLSTFVFDFMAGADFKLIRNKKEVCKFFIQGKANLGLKFIVNGDFDTAAPLITNFQAGVLFPFGKYKKSAGELY
jgi:hypothetical protein